VPPSRFQRHVREFLNQHLLAVVDWAWGPMVIRRYTPGHSVLQMQPHVISFYGVTSRTGLRSPPPRPASIPELKVGIRTATETVTADSYRQFGASWLVVLLSVESQTVRLYSACKVCDRHLQCCSVRSASPKLFKSGDHFYQSECSTDRPTLVPFESKLFKILNYSV
jgi:hypothetical protein